MEELKVFLENIAANNLVLWYVILVLWMAISNIVPITFFILPDIFVFLWIFMAVKLVSWWIPWALLILGAIIWESISYFVWYKYGDKILKMRVFKSSFAKSFIEKIKKNQVKYFIIWKFTPWLMRIVPFSAGLIKMDFKKFLFYNFIMIVYWISYLFIVWIVWFKVALHFLWENAIYLFAVAVIIYLWWEIWKRKNKKL